MARLASPSQPAGLPGPPPFDLTLPVAPFTVEAAPLGQSRTDGPCEENEPVTKKEIVKQIAEKIEETQLKTKEIVQLTFDAIVETLINDRRIELRNFGVFEVKLRKARKARNPRTDDPVDVPPKYVVTFKPGKEMEERVRKLIPSAEELEALERKSQKAAQNRQPAQPEPAPAAAAAAVSVPADGNGATPEPTDGQTARPKKPRARKATQV